MYQPAAQLREIVSSNLMKKAIASATRNTRVQAMQRRLS